jgi:hypothetical protein
MMTLGGVTLDHDLQWDDEFKVTFGTGTAERALDGTLVTQHRMLSKVGRPITLVGTESSGWLTRSTIESLLTLATDTTATYTLGIGATMIDDPLGGPTPVPNPNYREFTVQFCHDQSPVIDMTPITLLPDEPDSGFWYYGTIKLRTVA